MSTDEIVALRKAACQYVASHSHDYSQIFTAQDCHVDFLESPDQNDISVQVWVQVPAKKLRKLAKGIDW